MTNLWDGLRTGMNLFNDLPASTTSRLSALFILTDGQPNIEPPRGHIPMLEHYLESHPIVRSALTISSFGFGYNLDSMLLSEIGRVGGGAYSFIPDSGLVGTVFVHAVANMHSTYAIRCALNVEVPEGVKVKQVRGRFTKLDASWGSKVEFGDLQYGQTRDIVLEFEGGDQGKLPEVTVSVVAKPWVFINCCLIRTKLTIPSIYRWFANEALTVSVTHTPSAVPAPTTEAHKYHLHRLDLVDSIFSLCSQKNLSTAAIKTATQNFENQSKTINTSLPNYPDAVALASDIGGEVVLALSEQKNWKRWGMHYFPALACAHQRQQCSNFKDAGLQVYGQHSPLFIRSRDELDAAFDKLPPPKPSRKVYVHTNTNTPGGKARVAVAQRQAPVNMARWNNRYGGCFAGECQVQLEGGKKVALCELKRGMNVVTPKGSRKVGAVVRIAIEGGRLMMCRIGELRVTPWHPIRIEGKWVFPGDVVEGQLEECAAVYTVLLEADSDVDAHAFDVEGVTAVTLGHGLVASKEADVRAHPFFGSYTKVLNGLKELAGFESEDGLAHCVGVHRDSAGLIAGFVKPTVNGTSLGAVSHVLIVSA